jgi:hypothetical protein
MTHLSDWTPVVGVLTFVAIAITTVYTIFINPSWFRRHVLEVRVAAATETRVWAADSGRYLDTWTVSIRLRNRGRSAITADQFHGPTVICLGAQSLSVSGFRFGPDDRDWQEPPPTAGDDIVKIPPFHLAPRQWIQFTVETRTKPDVKPRINAANIRLKTVNGGRME